MEEKNPSLKIANEFLTVYSTSPGLKQFKTSSFLGMFNFFGNGKRKAYIINAQKFS